MYDFEKKHSLACFHKIFYGIAQKWKMQLACREVNCICDKLFNGSLLQNSNSLE